MIDQAKREYAQHRFIEEARHRLEVLAADSADEAGRQTLRLTYVDHCAIRTALAELHRLHLAVSEQRKTLESISRRKKEAAQKPKGARSQTPKARSTTEKSHNP